MTSGRADLNDGIVNRRSPASADTVVVGRVVVLVLPILAEGDRRRRRHVPRASGLLPVLAGLFLHGHRGRAAGDQVLPVAECHREAGLKHVDVDP